MAVKLSKGSNIKLAKDTDALKSIRVLLEWETPENYRYGKFDLDVTAYGLIPSPDTPSKFELFDEEYFIYYENLKTSNGSIIHMGDDLDGSSEGEEILVDLSKIPDVITNIPFFVTIHRADKKQQHFGMVSGSKISIIDKITNEVIAYYNLGNEFNGYTAVQFGSLHKTSEGWEFVAIGNGYKMGLVDILYSFGLEV